MNLNAWIRIWIIVSGLLLVATIAVAFMLKPGPKDVAHHPSFYDSLSPTAKAQLAPQDAQEVGYVKMPNGHVAKVRPGIALTKSSPLVAEYTALLERKAWQRQVQLINGAGAAWFLASLLLLLVGLAVAWVRRRIRRLNNEY